MEKAKKLRPSRKANLKKAAQLCYKQGPLSRATLAKELKLTTPAVSELVAILVECQILFPCGTGRSSGGRRPGEFTFNPSYKHIIAISSSGSSVTMALSNLMREELSSLDFTFPVEKSYAELYEKIVNTVALLQQQAGYLPESLGAIVVSSPGIVDTRSQTIRTIRDSHVKIADSNLLELLRMKYKTNFHLGNNMDLEAFGEYTCGQYQGVQNLSLIRIEQDGLGAGHVLGGKLLEGEHHSIGEIGYLPFPLSGLDASSPPILTLEHYIQKSALLQNETDKSTYLSHYANLWAYVIACTHAVMGSERIILGGKAYQWGPLLLQQVQARLASLLPFPIQIDFPHFCTEEDHIPGLKGAFALGSQLVLEHLSF